MCQVRDYDLEFVTADTPYNSIHMIKSKRMKQEENVACGRGEVHTGF
jgi:hypothetical protein